MTGVATTFSGAAVTASLFKIPPVTPGQTLWEYFGDSLVHSPNLIGANPTLIGSGQVFSPTGNYATLTPLTGALDTGLGEVAGSFTAMFVARSTATTGIAAPMDAFGTGGCQITLGNNNGLHAFVPGGGTANLSVIPGGSMSFKFYAIVYTAGTGISVYDLTDAPDGSVTAIGAGTGTRTVALQTWKLGQQSDGAASGQIPIDLAWVGLCQGSALSVSTLTAVYNSVKSSLALRNITI